MCLHGRRRGRHQGSEGRWEAMRALSFRPFCPCDGRRVSLGDLSARSRYTTYFQARLAFTMAAFNVLVQWHGFQPNASGFVPLSMAEFSL